MANSIETERYLKYLEKEYGKDTADKLVSYIDMVLDLNNYINLTAVRERDEAIQKHLADSLTITSLPEYRSAQSIIDVGTGAGFPGAILAIADPDKEFVLLDSTLKRLRVIDEFADKLGISNLRTVHARAEEISKQPDYKEKFDICVSRAVASLDKLTGWCLPFVQRNGFFIAYKGESYREELQQAHNSLRKFKGRLERVVKIDSESDDISGHVLMVIRKM